MRHITSWDNLDSIRKRGLVPYCRSTMTEEQGLDGLVEASQLADEYKPEGYPSRLCSTYFQSESDLSIMEGIEKIPLVLHVDDSAAESCAFTTGGQEAKIRTALGTSREVPRAKGIWRNTDLCSGEECTEYLESYERGDPEVFCDNHIPPESIQFPDRLTEIEPDIPHDVICQENGGDQMCHINIDDNISDIMEGITDLKWKSPTKKKAKESWYQVKDQFGENKCSFQDYDEDNLYGIECRDTPVKRGTKIAEVVLGN